MQKKITMVQETATIVNQLEMTGGYMRLTLQAPGVAGLARPGQFVHARVPGLEESVLRRPFSICDAGDGTLSILYKRVGVGTAQMATLPNGAEVDLIGPLGNGFPMPREGAQPVLVAGGYGVAPLYFLARKLSTTGHLFAGGKTSADILCAGEFERLGWTVHAATEDGSLGTRGYVTEALLPWLAGQPAAEVFACGPDGLLRALSQNVSQPLWVSLDKHMVCGVGACLACVQKIIQPDGSVAQMRVCHDGPVFAGRSVVWN